MHPLRRPHRLIGYVGSPTGRIDGSLKTAGTLPYAYGGGTGLMLLGIGSQVVQLIVSIRNRDSPRDFTGDPWDGRTLEWITTSPPPAYNFAVLPNVRAKKPIGTSVASFWVESGTSLIYTPGVPMALAALAIGQMGVHLAFFLHITTGPDNTNNVRALAFGVLIVGIVIGGSLWIMYNLNVNMMVPASIMNMQTQP